MTKVGLTTKVLGALSVSAFSSAAVDVEKLLRGGVGGGGGSGGNSPPDTIAADAKPKVSAQSSAEAAAAAARARSDDGGTEEETTNLVAIVDGGRRKLPASTCDSYYPIGSGTTLNTIQWLGSGGADTEWLNVANWATNYLPGTDRFNRLIMTVGDHGTVHCPATYMTHDVELEMRSSSTLDVTADLNIGDDLIMITNSKITQSGQSTVTVGKTLSLAASYELSGQAHLAVGNDVVVSAVGGLTIDGDGSSVTAESASEVNGVLTYALGPNGAGLFTVNSSLLIGAGAGLVVDAAAYDFSSVSGTVLIPLIMYTSSTGSFAPANIALTGVPGGLTSQIKSEADGVYLELVGQGGPPPPPPAPVPVPVATPPPTDAPTDTPTSGPTPVPTLAPSPHPTQCNSNADCDDGNDCTLDMCHGDFTCDHSGNACGSGEVCVEQKCVNEATSPPTPNPVTAPPTPNPVAVTAPPTPYPVATTAAPIAPPSPGNDPIVAAIPDAQGYNLVYELDPIPSAPDFTSGVDYTRTDLDHPPFSRVAYFVKLESPDFGRQWAWVSMDSFTSRAAFTGVPCPDPACGQGTIQKSVTGVNVVSNVPGFNGTSLEGNVEFWPFNYAYANSHNIPHASDDTYDTGDSPASTGNFGSMQVHAQNPSDPSGPRQTIFAFNRFNKGHVADLGIGSNPDPNYPPDWTFAGNADSYTTRKLQVYVNVKDDGPVPPTPPSPPTVSPPFSTPTPAPVPLPTTAAPVSSMTTVVTLGASSVDSISHPGDCPGQITDDLLIDGSAYAAGPGTVTLYQCASIGFDPMKIELKDFPAGLWFEIVSGSTRTGGGNGVDLVVKSLTDYSEYFRGYSYTGDYPFETNRDHFPPNFSWETVPKWIAFRKNSALTTDELNSIATKNYISWYGVVTPQEVKDMAASIKNINPNFKMLYYFNSFGYWGNPGGEEFTEDWLQYRVTNTGRRVYIWDKSGNRRFYNHTIPEFRDWWVRHALEMNSDPNIDGVFADATMSAEDTLHSNMIKDLAAQIPSGSLKMGNFLRQVMPDGNRWRMDYEEGSYMENTKKGPINQPEGQAIVVSIQLAREALWKGKLVLWNGSPMNCDPNNCGVVEEDMPEYIKPTLAEYLILAEEHAYYNFNVSPSADKARWMWDTSEMEEFKRPLGRPLGPPVKVGNVLTRHFEHVSVKFDALAHTGTLEWDEWDGLAVE